MSTTSQRASVLSVIVGLTFGCGGEIPTMPGTTQSQTSGLGQCVPPPANLAAWWRAEGDANDTTLGNNGTILNVGFAPGEVGQAFSFSGTGSQVSIATPNFETPNTGFTVEGWVSPTSLGSCSALTCNTIAHREKSMASRTWWLGIDGASIRFLILRTAPNSGAGDVSSPAVVTAGSFQHIAASYDGNTVKLYRNGILVAAQIVGPANFNTGDPINIGIENLTVSGIVDQLGGLIDELSIYNRALSDIEIAAIFGGGIAGKCPPAIIGADAGVPADAGIVPVYEDDYEQEDQSGNGEDYNSHRRNRHHHNGRHDNEHNGRYGNGHHDDGHHDDGHLER